MYNLHLFLWISQALCQSTHLSKFGAEVFAHYFAFTSHYIPSEELVNIEHVFIIDFNGPLNLFGIIFLITYRIPKIITSCSDILIGCISFTVRVLRTPAVGLFTTQLKFGRTKLFRKNWLAPNI